MHVSTKFTWCPDINKNQKVLKTRMHKKKEPYLENFIEYVQNETTLNNDLLFCREALVEFIV